MIEWQSLQRLSRSEASKERGPKEQARRINSASFDTILIQDHKEFWYPPIFYIYKQSSLVAALSGQFFIPRYKTSLITSIILGNVTKMKTEHEKSTPHTIYATSDAARWHVQWRRHCGGYKVYWGTHANIQSYYLERVSVQLLRQNFWPFITVSFSLEFPSTNQSYLPCLLQLHVPSSKPAAMDLLQVWFLRQTSLDALTLSWGRHDTLMSFPGLRMLHPKAPLAVGRQIYCPLSSTTGNTVVAV